MEILSEVHILDWNPDYPLLTVTKRYWINADIEDGYTLIFAHGIGFNKEQWEPTLNALFRLSHRKSPGYPRIREVWTIDCPNHGQAAILNDNLLVRGGYNQYVCA